MPRPVTIIKALITPRTAPTHANPLKTAGAMGNTLYSECSTSSPHQDALVLKVVAHTTLLFAILKLIWKKGRPEAGNSKTLDDLGSYVEKKPINEEGKYS